MTAGAIVLCARLYVHGSSYSLTCTLAHSHVRSCVCTFARTHDVGSQCSSVCVGVLSHSGEDVLVFFLSVVPRFCVSPAVGASDYFGTSDEYRRSVAAGLLFKVCYAHKNFIHHAVALCWSHEWWLEMERPV